MAMLFSVKIWLFCLQICLLCLLTESLFFGGLLPNNKSNNKSNIRKTVYITTKPVKSSSVTYYRRRRPSSITNNYQSQTTTTKQLFRRQSHGKTTRRVNRRNQSKWRTHPISRTTTKMSSYVKKPVTNSQSQPSYTRTRKLIKTYPKPSSVIPTTTTTKFYKQTQLPSSSSVYRPVKKQKQSEYLDIYSVLDQYPFKGGSNYQFPISMIDPSLINNPFDDDKKKTTAGKTEDQQNSVKTISNNNNNNNRIDIEDLLFGISFDDPNEADIKIEQQQAVDSQNNQENIVQVIAKNEKLQLLFKTIQDLNLSDTLRNLDQITLFAPSNEAFAQLGDNDKKLEANDVQRHVIKVSIPSESFATGPVFTLSKEIIILIKSPVKSTSTPNQLQYNGKSIDIVETDIQASNGVIHIIDSLIM